MKNDSVLSDVHLESVDGPMLHHIIVVPDSIAAQFKTDKGSSRIICKIGSGEEFPCALIPRHNRYIIAASKKLIKDHNLSTDKPFKIAIRTDPNNGLEQPEELTEVLAQDEFAAEVFDRLNDGSKRGYIYYIRQAKSVNTRIKRSLEIAEKIKERSNKL